jgi:hypothetical protein
MLGQVNPAATTETSLYVPTTAAAAVVSSIVVCNQASTAATYRIAVAASTSTSTGALAAAKEWIVYGATVAGNDSTILTVGITMTASASSLRVYASSANLSFSAFGSEIA